MKHILFLTLIFLLAVSCENTPPKHHSVTDEDGKEILLKQIDSLEVIYQKEGLADKFTVSKLINAYTEFRNKYKADERTPEYFLKAGNLAKSLNDWEKAAEVYKNFFNDFKNHPKREESLYLLGGIYDFWLLKKDYAKQTYEHYLKIYPKGEFADEVISSLRLIDVPLEERIKIFQEQSQ